MVAMVVALIIGRGIAMANARSTPTETLIRVADAPAAVRQRRRAIPLPAVGVALACLAVVFETTGFVVRLSGGAGQVARLLSMDAPFSLPRMFVALVFAIGALAAIAGAKVIEGRRTWWLAVGLVGAAIAAIKAGSTVHAHALSSLSRSVGSTMALLLSGLLAVAVVGVMSFVSRSERRDRRRVLGVLALYATAAVGLSALSSFVAQVYGAASSWAAAATYVEESGEALAGVAFFIAVLVGVAPRLVLPARWALRREADAHTLEVQGGLPVRTANRTSTSR